MIHYSIVVPVYNEEEVIGVFHEELRKTIDKISGSFEIIYTTGGNTDGTLDVLKKLVIKDTRVKVINLSHRFNYQVALSAGLDYAAGSAVISLDGDLQHPPGVIPELIAAYKSGFDIVNTVRNQTVGEDVFKKIGSRAFYFLVRVCTNIDLGKNCANFRLLSRKAVNALKRFPERKRYIPGMVGLLGFKKTNVSYTAGCRMKGTTKFSFSRMCSMAIDGIFSFSNTPIRVMIFFGMFMSFASFAFLVFIIVWRLLHPNTISGWASILGSVLFLSSLQILMLGFLGEYIGRIYEECKQRPLYIIDELVNFKNNV